MFQLSLVFYFNQACLQLLIKVPGSQRSEGLWLCSGRHLGFSPHLYFLYPNEITNSLGCWKTSRWGMVARETSHVITRLELQQLTTTNLQEGKRYSRLSRSEVVNDECNQSRLCNEDLKTSQGVGLERRFLDISGGCAVRKRLEVLTLSSTSCLMHFFQRLFI
jgi:hypothetical protein